MDQENSEAQQKVLCQIAVHLSTLNRLMRSSYAVTCVNELVVHDYPVAVSLFRLYSEITSHFGEVQTQWKSFCYVVVTIEFDSFIVLRSFPSLPKNINTK